MLHGKVNAGDADEFDQFVKHRLHDADHGDIGAAVIEVRFGHDQMPVGFRPVIPFLLGVMEVVGQCGGGFGQALPVAH